MTTIEELYSSVAQLGFETTLESDERFFYAANRALLQVNRIKPLTSIYKLNHFPLDNLIEGNTFEPLCKDKKALIFVADSPKSYYFECNGNGQVIIEKSNAIGETWETIGVVELSSLDGRFNEYKGFIRDGADFVTGYVRLRFTGEYLYYIQNVAMYGSLISTETKHIPVYAKYVAYDIASLTSDFLSLVCPPIVDAKRNVGFVLNDDYFVENDCKILIPASTKGVFDICNNRKPKEITSDSREMDGEIDWNAELCALLPNLIASYIWVDDEPEKAQYYLSLFREQVQEIAIQHKDMKPFVYRNKTGW